MINPFHRYRIDYVLFIVFAGFIVLLVTLIMATTYTLSAGEQARSTSFYQQGMLLELNKEIVLQLQAIERTSLTLSLNTPFLDFLALKGGYYERNQARKDVARDYLSPVVNSSTSIQSIQVYMDDPTFVDETADVQFLPRSYLQKESWYPMAQKADFMWIGEHTVNSPQGPSPVISLARTLSSPSGSNLGELVINVKAKALQSILSEDKPGARRLLLDPGGRLMVRTPSAPLMNEISGLLEGIRDPSGYRRLHLEPANDKPGKDVLMVWSQSFPDGWMLVEFTPWSDITKGSFRIAKTLAVIGGAAVVVALFFTLYLSRNFTAPIRQLLVLMNAYARNRSVLTYPDRYRNEFGHLFGGFRKLIDRIEELYQSMEQQYKAQREAEIKALQAMINPHFLYNTLDQLNWMAIEAGQDRISQVLELMGRMFRIGLSNGESFITLQEELLLSECYLQIQQLKWGDGLLQYSIAGMENTADFLIPKMTLQPFIENAVIHGLHGKRSGTVAIHLEELEAGIRIRIADNGVGIPPDWRERKRRKTGGYGIRNVMERVEAYFGAPYGIQLSALPGGKGTEATIFIPKIKEIPHADTCERSGLDVENRNCG
jgi:two-component system sensor histidine kinase YesM